MLRVNDVERRLVVSSLPSLCLTCIPLQLYQACLNEPKELVANECAFVVITPVMRVNIMAGGDVGKEAGDESITDCGRYRSVSFHRTSSCGRTVVYRLKVGQHKDTNRWKYHHHQKQM